MHLQPGKGKESNQSQPGNKPCRAGDADLFLFYRCNACGIYAIVSATKRGFVRTYAGVSRYPVGVDRLNFNIRCRSVVHQKGIMLSRVDTFQELIARLTLVGGNRLVNITGRQQQNTRGEGDELLPECESSDFHDTIL